MDLLEIRKKAKGLKAEEEEAARKAAEAGAGEPEEALGPDAEDVAVSAPGPEPKKKKAAAKRKRPAPVKAGEPAPEPVPKDEAGLGEMFLSLGDEEPPAEFEAGEAETLAEEAAGGPEPPVWEQKPPDDMKGETPPPPPATEEEAPSEGEESGETVVEYLAFRLGSEEYAVKVEDVREIIRLQKITDVPRAPGYVRGIISLRGVIIPVFDIKKRLGFEETGHTRATRIVVVAEEGMPQGIIVDKVTGVVRFPVKTVEPPPAVIGGVEAEYIHGVGRIGDRLLILFNTGRVLAMEG